MEGEAAMPMRFILLNNECASYKASDMLNGVDILDATHFLFTGVHVTVTTESQNHEISR